VSTMANPECLPIYQALATQHVADHGTPL